MKFGIFKHSKTYLTVFSLSFMLTACTSFFEKDNTPIPSPLKNYHREISPRLLWSSSIGQGASKQDYLKMSPSLTQNAIYTSSTDGIVTSTNKNNGFRNWQVNLNTPITSGPSAGSQLIVLGCQNGRIIALHQSNGGIAWNTSVEGEVIAKPAISNAIVVVKTVDGYTYGLSAKDGKTIWSYQQVEPNLILRGSSAPLISGQSIIAGFANGSLVKLALNDGELQWQQTVAIAQGAFAIQRMIDIDADPILYHHNIYVATYQGRIASLDWTSGQTLWTRDISTYTGMTADDNAVYVSDTGGLVRKYDAANGEIKWRQDSLQYRLISAPANMNNYVVVGDGQGYLHWLNKANGRIAGRASLGTAIYAAPIAENNVLYALTNSGYLAAYTIK